ncbi:hypothetical protein DTO271D3_6783 [Paecilomyces variotii]|nr:hypothetical protein DTO271D3_6783 [Paecilomyces variotii]
MDSSVINFRLYEARKLGKSGLKRETALSTKLAAEAPLRIFSTGTSRLRCLENHEAKYRHRAERVHALVDQRGCQTQLVALSEQKGSPDSARHVLEDDGAAPVSGRMALRKDAYGASDKPALSTLRTRADGDSSKRTSILPLKDSRAHMSLASSKEVSAAIMTLSTPSGDDIRRPSLILFI